MASPEEIAYTQKWINGDTLLEQEQMLAKTDDGRYLFDLTKDEI
ncbi:hypothetical protein CLV89_12515 [Tritonibacter scottomollicae]|uniref:Uncharacterized protein n=2 Tax=Tritonibacter scottomollicae TaxID=483013 RepID=A0A2T1A5K2_TRISK|nr:hypothetical protein CLV89_12515 [Tritonibacter scottomollicae]